MWPFLYLSLCIVHVPLPFRQYSASNMSVSYLMQLKCDLSTCMVQVIWQYSIWCYQNLTFPLFMIMYSASDMSVITRIWYTLYLSCAIVQVTCLCLILYAASILSFIHLSLSIVQVPWLSFSFAIRMWHTLYLSYTIVQVTCLCLILC